MMSDDMFGDGYFTPKVDDQTKVEVMKTGWSVIPLPAVSYGANTSSDFYQEWQHQWQKSLYSGFGLPAHLLTGSDPPLSAPQVKREEPMPIYGTPTVRKKTRRLITDEMLEAKLNPPEPARVVEVAPGQIKVYGVKAKPLTAEQQNLLQNLYAEAYSKKPEFGYHPMVPYKNHPFKKLYDTDIMHMVNQGPMPQINHSNPDPFVPVTTFNQ